MTNQEPLKVKCFQCKKELTIKWVIGRRNYSQKNNWGFWTERKEDENKQICNDCLRFLQKERSDDYRKLLSPKKRLLFSVYLAGGKFN